MFLCLERKKKQMEKKVLTGAKNRLWCLFCLSDSTTQRKRHGSDLDHQNCFLQYLSGLLHVSVYLTNSKTNIKYVLSFLCSSLSPQKNTALFKCLMLCYIHQLTAHFICLCSGFIRVFNKNSYLL